MEKIAVKTKINMWAAVGDKEKIVFDTLDFAPDQVASIDRLIRHNKEDKVSMTIEPENKQLQFGTVVSNVRLVSMNCMGKGQKIKIADFKSSDERASTLKRMVESETVVIITIEQIQGGLFDDKEDRPGLDDNQPDPADPKSREYKVDENGVIINPEIITVKFPKSYGSSCKITLGCSNENWYFGYDIKIGNNQEKVFCENEAGESIPAALMAAKDEIYDFIDRQKTFKYAKQTRNKIEKTINDWLYENS